MNDSPQTVAATYFDSWKARDFATFRSVLADDVAFDAPMDHVDNPDGCTRAVEHLAEVVTDIVIQRVFGDGLEVLT